MQILLKGPGASCIDFRVSSSFALSQLILSGAAELAADGGKAGGVCPKQSPRSLSALLQPCPLPFFLSLKSIGTASEVC